MPDLYCPIRIDGMGLNLARSFVELHDGTLDLSSELNVGTCVQFTLPNARIVQHGGAVPQTQGRLLS